MWGVSKSRIYRFSISIAALYASLNLIGCKADQNVFATPNASIGGSGGGNNSIDENAGFKLTLKEKSGVSGLLHRFGSSTTAGCEIDKTTTTPTALHCLLNMMEYDLYFYGFEIALSVPKNFCNFLEMWPYRFWKVEPGYGPTTMAVSVDATGTMTACTVDGVAGTISGNVCYSGKVTLTADGKSQCQYDYSKEKFGSFAGPNCCFGSGTLSTTVNNGTTVTTTSNRIEWGGTAKGCLESPHDYLDTWPKTADSLAAVAVVELGESGYATSTKFTSAFKLQADGKRPSSASVMLHANMFHWSQYQTNPATWSTASSFPRAYRLGADRGAAGTRAGAGATTISTPSFGQYQYLCKGPAGELKHSINLWVQSWNTYEQYTAYKDGTTAYTAANPYVQGTAGVDCAAVGSSLTCNSFWSFEDLFIQYGASNPLAYVFPNEYSRADPP